MNTPSSKSYEALANGNCERFAKTVHIHTYVQGKSKGGKDQITSVLIYNDFWHIIY